MQTLCLPAELASLEKFRVFVNERAVEHGVAASLIPRIELVLEELFTNLAHHAYKESAGKVEVACFARTNAFCMRVTDWGSAFNPLERPPPDLTAGIEDRPIGGLGIHLVRNSADDLDYRRENDKNIVTACFRNPA